MKHKLYYQFAGSCFLLVFVFLGYVVKFYPNWLQGFDITISQTIQQLRPQATLLFSWLTKFGNVSTVVILAVTFLVLFIYGKRYIEAIWLAGGLIGIALAVTNLAKIFFHRPRPSGEHLVYAPGMSFPSGHATGSMILYGTLLFLLPIFIQNKTYQKIGQVLLALFIFLIGVSRIYLGVHYPSDVIAGFCLGLSWLCFTYPIYLEKRFVWRFTKKQL
ncbi:phosphatase PAP2 family protein [Enterococcus columbae]|uniref:Type 2 phosphatidic acid phosphatase n=1 Tax=Enterococcus columbae DSM 7374 = ATCC 51263 TaxID=1121865 RepID=S1N4A7_9ENTE|nr:phosphatase PAP2 family protein [Enterococcus columbae]EOT40402.1 type 2 phosphatidic acid phosphatase [Enterococcus columbae DSM 7374 = ATCC 51263]EOW80428.1 type 2 phosphatidic acid phosphatase [Enterococcus columbae DSM 7374 = ATCC 51263]